MAVPCDDGGGTVSIIGYLRRAMGYNYTKGRARIARKGYGHNGLIGEADG